MIQAYIQLFRLKPIGLIMSMVLFAHVYALNETGLTFRWGPAIILFLTTSLANAAVFALNQYYERDADAKMERTKNRPLPSGKIPARVALYAGTGLFFASIAAQIILINTNTAIATFICGALYVWTYTPLKNRSSLSTLIGSLPGATLPFIGWYSVTQGVDLMIIWMSIMIFLWQTPHTFAIVYRYKQQFEAAGGKQLELVAGEEASFRQTAWYTIVNFPLILIPAVFKISGDIYVGIAALFTIIATYFMVKFYKERSEGSAKRYFYFMLSYLPVLFVFMAWNRV